MIKAINNAKGIEVTKPKPGIILITGHTSNAEECHLIISVEGASHLFDSTDPTEIYIEHGDGRYVAGIVDWKPQGTEIMFLPKYGIYVDSAEFKKEIERVLAD